MGVIDCRLAWSVAAERTAGAETGGGCRDDQARNEVKRRGEAAGEDDLAGPKLLALFGECSHQPMHCVHR